MIVALSWFLSSFKIGQQIDGQYFIHFLIIYTL